MFTISRRQILCASTLWLAGLSGARARSTKPYALWVEADLASRSNGMGPAILQGVNEALLAKPELAKWIDIQIINHQGNPDRLVDQLNALAKASDMTRVIGMVGGGDGNLAPIAARWALGSQIPYLMTWASNPRMLAQIQAETQTQAYLLRKAVTDDIVFDHYLESLQHSGKKRWGLMLVNDGLGRASYDYILESAMSSSGGIELVGVHWHDINAAQISMQYQSLKQRGAQSIFMVTHPYAVQNLAKALVATMALSEPSRRQQQIIPIICSSNAWSPQPMNASLQALSRAPFYFALPQNWQLSPSKEPVVGFTNLLAQEWLGALSQTKLSSNSSLGRTPLLAQLLPPSAWQDERLAMQFARYGKQGEVTFTNLSSAWN